MGSGWGWERPEMAEEEIAGGLSRLTSDDHIRFQHIPSTWTPRTLRSTEAIGKQQSLIGIIAADDFYGDYYYCCNYAHSQVCVCVCVCEGYDLVSWESMISKSREFHAASKVSATTIEMSDKEPTLALHHTK